MFSIIFCAHLVGEEDDEGTKDKDGSRDGVWLMLGDDDGTEETIKEGDWLVLGADDGDIVGVAESEGLCVCISCKQSWMLR